MARNFPKLGAELGELVAEKQIAYGQSYQHAGEVLRILFPDGVKPEQYRDLLAIARVLDKLFRIASRKDAFGESPWNDIAGYALLSIQADAEEAANSEVH